jgi:hypothetical protein
MKTRFGIVTLIAALGLVGLASTASAGVDIDINIRPPRPPVVVIGGDSHHRERGWDRHDRYDRHDRHDRRDHGHRGYWKEITVKVWVPGRMVVSCDRHGREYRHRERGHYVYRTDRVWVSRRG